VLLIRRPLRQAGRPTRTSAIFSIADSMSRLRPPGPAGLRGEEAEPTRFDLLPLSTAQVHLSELLLTYSQPAADGP
jgi:hypothetical protein